MSPIVPVILLILCFGIIIYAIMYGKPVQQRPAQQVVYRQPTSGITLSGNSISYTTRSGTGSSTTSIQLAGAPFSGINEKEMDGVGETWAGKPNPVNPNRPVLVSTGGPRMTYYGHGIPLRPVPPGPFMGPLKLAHNTRLVFKPECCPSPYSSDQGCMCGAIEDIRNETKGI